MAGTSQGAQGTNTGGMERSPAARRRQRQKLAAQQQRWAKKAGPVTVTQIVGAAEAACGWCAQDVDGQPIALYVGPGHRWWGHTVCVAAAKEAVM